MEEKRSDPWKALRITAIVLLVLAALAFLFVAFTFLVSFFIGGQIITDGTGLMRFFLKSADGVQHRIDAAKFGLAGMPALGAVTLFLVYCCVLLAYLRKKKKKGENFPGARGYWITLWVLTVLTLAVPMVIWAFCAKGVAGSGFFTMPFPLPISGFILMSLNLFISFGAGSKQQAPADDA